MIFVHSKPVSDCYFIGIGGISMSALALLLRDRGVKVRGSDACEGEMTKKLRACGIPVHIGDGEEITEELVVFTGAVSEDNRQLTSARRAGKIILSRAELLGTVASSFRHVVSIAGCHGKTTTCCMLSHILLTAGKPFACHIGGEDLDLGNYHSVGGEYFVTEACEFKRSFLQLESEIGVVLNCDRDHTDCYKTRGELLAAYGDFAARSACAVVNADDIYARNIPHALSFGLHNGEIRAERLRSDGERYSFTVTEGGNPVIRLSLRVVGVVNVMNALAAYACARRLGLTAEEIRRGIESFRGVKRRFEYVGTFGGVPVVCDYAHHPREIAATLYTAQRLTEGRVHLVFQPHTYTRTRDLMESFVQSLSKAEAPIVYKTYAARETYDWAGSAACLASKIASAAYVASPSRLELLLKGRVTGGDMVLVLGAGDIYSVIKTLLNPI